MMSTQRELEESCWQLLLPYLARWLDQVPSVTYPFGCWNYDIPGNKPTYLNVHVLNAFQLGSPFTERRDELISSLLAMLEDGGKEHPQATGVCCSTWLNRFEPFNALFPTSWAESFVLTRYYATYGWWGQYMDHRGAFHSPRAERVRRDGWHPYPAGRAECRLCEAIEHLNVLAREPIQPTETMSDVSPESTR